MRLSADAVIGIVAVVVALPPVVLAVLKYRRYMSIQQHLPIHEHHRAGTQQTHRGKKPMQNKKVSADVSRG